MSTSPIAKAGKKTLRSFLSEYSFYYIYESDGTAAPPARSDGLAFRRIDERSAEAAAPAFRERVLKVHLGENQAAFGAWLGERLVAAAWCEWGPEYDAERLVWPLEEGAAKFIQLDTDEEYQNRGIGRALLAQSAREMRQLGFCPIYGRVWWSNAASNRMVLKAGWRRIAVVLRVAFTPRLWIRLIVRRRPRLRVSLCRQDRAGD